MNQFRWNLFYEAEIWELNKLYDNGIITAIFTDKRIIKILLVIIALSPFTLFLMATLDFIKANTGSLTHTLDNILNLLSRGTSQELY